jgi:predicted nuclease with TOPRIM domain
MMEFNLRDEIKRLRVENNLLQEEARRCSEQMAEIVSLKKDIDLLNRMIKQTDNLWVEAAEEAFNGFPDLLTSRVHLLKVREDA